jgi:hypothetical protein
VTLFIVSHEQYISYIGDGEKWHQDEYKWYMYMGCCFDLPTVETKNIIWPDQQPIKIGAFVVVIVW